ncbi:TPA: hypothetical protein LVM22_001172 [Klebsiella oxytoca]|nr:hypothetical protein [Klebsiella oxytoca]
MSLSLIYPLFRRIRQLYDRYSPLRLRPPRPLTTDWQMNLQHNMWFRGRIEPSGNGRYRVAVDRRRGGALSLSTCEYGFAQAGEFGSYRQAFRAALESAAQLARYRYAYTGLETA